MLEPSSKDLAESDVISTACMLGDLASTGTITCAFSYTVPGTPLTGSIDARHLVAAVTFDALDDTVVEDSINNAAVACVVEPHSAVV